MIVGGIPMLIGGSAPAQSHRYWRCQVVTLNGGAGTRMEIQELNFGDVSQVSFTTAVCTCTAADAVGIINNQGGTNCKKLTDNNSTDAAMGDLLFAADIFPQITMDYGSAVTPHYIRQAKRDTDARQVITCTVWYSDNGADFTQLGTLTLPTTTTNNTFAAWLAIQ